MKWRVRFGVLIISLICGVKVMPVIYVNSGDNTSRVVRYTALGDSIAYGYGIEDREKESYVGKVKAYLETQFDQVIVTNFGTNGLQSGELLSILTDEAQEEHDRYRATLKYADVITLSVGSNDLLHLIRLDMDEEEIMEDGGKCFEDACRRFAVTFPAIIKEIRKINPDAKIYANTVYNPAKGLHLYHGIYGAAEYYIGLLNEVIRNTEGIRVVDVKKAFDDQEDSMINVSLNGREIDPHPSREGYDLIAKIVIKEMAQ